MLSKVFKIIVYIFAVIGFGFVSMYIALKTGLTNDAGIIDHQRYTLMNTSLANQDSEKEWKNSEEWKTLRTVIGKDAPAIRRAAETAGSDPRLIFSILSIEQLRLYTSEREIFKKVFAPLQILGNQSQFSWGVLGIKKETAIEIENNLKDKKTPFYLGEKFEKILDFKTKDTAAERFARLTNEHDRYYSYLYGALLLKQLETQWQSAGFPIGDRPEILSTLFNIGFTHSKPNASPHSGGARIRIGDKEYSFGGLAKEIYNSHELLGEFPKK